MDRHLQEASRFKHRVGGNRLGDARNALHAEHIGIGAFVNASAVAKRPVHRLEEEALARHLTVFHGKAEETGMRNSGITITEANNSRSKLHHFGKAICTKALAVGTEETDIISRTTRTFIKIAGSTVIGSGQLIDIINRVDGTFVYGPIKTAPAHSIHTIHIGIDIVAKRLHKVNAKSKERRQNKRAIAVIFKRIAVARGTRQTDFITQFKGLTVPELRVFQDNIRIMFTTRLTSFHCGLQPKGRERPYGQQRRWSPDQELQNVRHRRCRNRVPRRG